jgi:hypothetical protein
MIIIDITKMKHNLKSLNLSKVIDENKLLLNARKKK